MDDLLEARNRWRRGDRGAALDRLLVAWRHTPDPVLASLIETLSDRLCAGSSPLPGDNREDRARHWVSAANRGDTTQVARLLHALPTFDPSTARRLVEEHMAAWDPDPRVSTALTALVDQPPRHWESARAYGLWRSLLQVLGDQQDPRDLQRLEPVLSRSRQTIRPTPAENTFRRLLPVLLDRLPSEVRLPGPARGTLRTWKASLAPRSERDLDALYAAVYQDPEDLGRRMVLADALQEVADPRGELIALQSVPGPSPSQRRRIKELLVSHERTWLGPLAEVVLRTGLRFEHGFVAVARASSRSVGAVKRLKGRPEWATIRELDLSTWPRGTAVVCDPVMRGLRVLRGAHGRVFDSDVPIPVETLSLRWHLEPYALLLAMESTALPRLRDLQVRVWTVPEEMNTLWDRPLVRQLDHLGLEVYDHRTWPGVAPRLPGSFDLTLTASYDRWRLSFHRDERGRLSRLVVRDGWKNPARADLRQLPASLAPIEPAALSSLEVQLPEGPVANEAEITLLRTALERRFTTLEALEFTPA